MVSSSRSRGSAVIYQVDLEITSPEILPKFNKWLSQHIEQMLQFDGFESARWLQDSENNHRISVQYMVANQRKLKEYFDKYADSMRSDGMERFPGQFKARRKIWRHVNDKPRREHMEFKIDNILSELSRFANVKSLRAEIMKVTKELRHLQKLGTRQAKETIKTLEKRYVELLKQFNQMQKQLDQEIVKAVSAIEKTRTEVEDAFNTYRKKAIDQQNIVFGAAKKVATTAKKAAKKTTKKIAKKAKSKAKKTKKAAKKTVAKKSAKASTKKATSKAKTTKKVAAKKTTKKKAAKKTTKKATKKK